MITYEVWSKRPNHFRRLTGLTLEEFDELLDKFQSSYRFFIQREFLSKERKRAYGGGRHTRLHSLEDKLLFILVYVRIYPLEFMQGAMFNMAESRSCEWIHRLLPILDEAMDFAHVKPKRGRGRNLEEILRDFPEIAELGIFADGTERFIRRPKSKDKQKSRYSGKKKRHSVKNIVITHPRNNAILFLGKTQDGKVQDKRCMEDEKIKCRDPIKMLTDLGLLGLKIPNIQVVMPKRKPRGGALTDNEKAINSILSSIRVKIEHAIAGVKRNRSVLDTCRNIKEETPDLLMSIACGLHNLRVAHRYC
jgi:hypothetical protein